MALSKKTGVLLAVLISAVSFTAIACESEIESVEPLSQANPVENGAIESVEPLSQADLVENEAVVTGEILGIEDERVRLQLPEGETREFLIPRNEIERLALLPERVITAELDPYGRATEVRLGEVVYPIQTDTPEAVGLAQVQSAPTDTLDAVEVVPVPSDPTPIAQAQQPPEEPTPVRALW